MDPEKSEDAQAYEVKGETLPSIVDKYIASNPAVRFSLCTSPPSSS